MSTASAANANPAKPKSRSRLSELFFIKRRPRRGISLDWDKPDDPVEYNKMIDQEGFVSTQFWKEDDITQYPIIWQDLEDLEEHLLPTFFQFSQKSKYYQNNFYMYQWIFIIGAFATTVLGALASINYVAGDAGVDDGRYALQQFFSGMTAVVGAITAFTTALSNRREPQKRWGKTRRLAEELRMTYFQYLSHLPPFDKPDRVQKLRETVINIRVKEQENV